MQAAPVDLKVRVNVDAPRVHALDHAIRSFAVIERPPSTEAIVERAEQFLKFLDPDSASAQT